MNENTCGCCEGTEKITPEPTENRPGLDALTYRVGTHATFLETMLASLSRQDLPALAALTTRETSDPAIALLDAGATMLDVLTFYQERIANEGYLRTATERRSILELARLVGYKLRPGVASSVYLAFTLDPGYQTDIPAGTRAQSIPAPGEQPQAFETSDPLPARTEWNTLQPRLTRPVYATFGTASGLNTLRFKTASANLKPNDPLLLVFETDPGAQVLHRVASAETKFAENRTLVTLQSAVVQASVTALSGLLALVDRYLLLENFQVSPATQMAKRVTGFLTQFRRQLTPGVSAPKLGYLINQLLPELREEHAIAIEGEYERLEPWVGGMIGELKAFETGLDKGNGTGTGAGTGALAASISLIGAANPPLAGLGNILPSLAQPPSVQPRNAQRLARSYQSVFSPQADTLPRLLTTFQPKLKGTLYQAWGNTKVTEDSELQSTQALRVKAAPFGHNAPLKTITDDEGVIVGQEEWGVDTATVVIQLSAAGAGQNLFESLSEDAVNAGLMVSQGQTTLDSGTIAIAAPETEYTAVLDEDLSATLTVQYSGVIGTIQQITVDLQGKQYRIENQTYHLGLSIDGEDVLDIGPGPGDKLVVFHNGLRLTLDFTDHSQFFATVEQVPFSAIGTQKEIVTLDAEYNQLLPGSWVVIERLDWAAPQVFMVNAVATVSKAAFNLTGKVTQLTLNQSWLTTADTSLSILRGTTVYAQSESLPLDEEPILDDISGSTIELGALYDGLESGRWIIVSGERTDIPNTTGVKGSELVMVAGVAQGVSQVDIGDNILVDRPGDTTHTTLTLANALSYTYKRDTVTIYGNVVKATHGETRPEVLGSGDARKKFQAFTLKQAPLTYVSAATPSGIESTLEVRVNDVRWPEVTGLIELGSNDRGYEMQTDDNAKTTVIFGDGEHGARLPTGAENVKATYRSGIGKPGNVAAEQISLLATKPLGVKSVINPLRASGGADKETRDQARRNAPLAVMALDRLVSVQDYADFARTFAGIGKATALELSDGRRTLVHVTVAGADDIPIDPASDLFLNLKQALHQFSGDPFQPLRLDVRKLKVLVIVARVRLLSDYAWEFVEPNLRAALLDTFSFTRRELGQDVTSSEVIATLQAVEGVAYVDLDVLDAVDEDADLTELEDLAQTLSLHDRISADLARVDPTTLTAPRPILPAQIAYLTPEIPDTVILTEISK